MDRIAATIALRRADGLRVARAVAERAGSAAAQSEIERRIAVARRAGSLGAMLASARDAARDSAFGEAQRVTDANNRREEAVRESLRAAEDAASLAMEAAVPRLPPPVSPPLPPIPPQMPTPEPISVAP